MINHGIAAALLAGATLTGLISNSIALYAVCRYKHLHNTFGVLCGVLAITNVGDSLIHLLWSAFGPYLFEDETLVGKQGKTVGQLGLLLLDIKVYAHLGVSINRLFSLVSPLRYHALESDVKVTALFVAFPIVFAVLQIIPLFWSNDCYFVYYKDIAVWGYDETPCNDIYSFYVDFLLPVVLFCVIILLDGFTAIKSFPLYDEGFKSICQMALSIAVYISFCFVSYNVSNDWALFGATTLAWALYHALDGIIMVFFQARRICKLSQVAIFKVVSTNGQTAPTKT